MQTLAVKYRPKTWEDVVEQDVVKTVLEAQLADNTIKHAYLFCGGAGTGKTTCARVFAQKINHGEGAPIEIDAASNSGVDNVRQLIQQAKTKSVSSEYKVFIIDECHAISNAGWQAFLKLIEEPPAKSIFIFCTTDPQKIPATIISRVQRFNFQKITIRGIEDRLKYILRAEKLEYENDAVNFIATLAEGGLRDAITMMDKCLSYDKNLTLDNVTAALKTVNTNTYVTFLKYLINREVDNMVHIIDSVYMEGIDLRTFIATATNTLTAILLYQHDTPMSCVGVTITSSAEEFARDIQSSEAKKERAISLLDTLIKLQRDIRWENSPKGYILGSLLLFTY